MHILDKKNKSFCSVGNVSNYEDWIIDNQTENVSLFCGQIVNILLNENNSFVFVCFIFIKVYF